MSNLLNYFEYAHLPIKLQTVSKPFGDLAHEVYHRGGDPAEVTTCLRKLLEAKDCAVRAFLITQAEVPHSEKAPSPPPVSE